jgi:hypothetical protein
LGIWKREGVGMEEGGSRGRWSYGARDSLSKGPLRRRDWEGVSENGGRIIVGVMRGKKRV